MEGRERRREEEGAEKWASVCLFAICGDIMRQSFSEHN